VILNVWDMHVDKNIFEIGYRSLNIIMGIKKMGANNTNT